MQPIPCARRGIFFPSKKAKLLQRYVHLRIAILANRRHHDHIGAFALKEGAQSKKRRGFMGEFQQYSVKRVISMRKNMAWIVLIE
jgi:hypothetical protein